MQRVIGLMSGTSLDGVDAAWIETDGVTVRATGGGLTLPYDDSLRHDLRQILEMAEGLSPHDAFLADVTHRLTQRHLQAVQALDTKATLIGFHGQTILHRPAERRTWQIGDAALLARATGVPVAFDFRSHDVQAGGQGAPLVPVYHQALAAGMELPVAVLNIGGVANVTLVGPDGLLFAMDTGPGNALLDDWMLRHTGAPMDRDGLTAARGRACPGVLEQVLAWPFFQRPGPKSLDRQDFSAVLGLLEGLSVADGAATLAQLTALAVARAELPVAPRRWLVCGGGGHNPAIMAALRQVLAAGVENVEAVGWDGDALEAQCFAFLAMRVRRGYPLSYPLTTGVARPWPGGKIFEPGLIQS